MIRKLTPLLLIFGLVLSFSNAQQRPTIEVSSTYLAGGFDESAAEIVAYNPGAARAYLTNAEDNSVVALSLDANGQLNELFTIDMAPYGGGVNSVATYNNIVAVAVEAEVKQDLGSVVIFDLDGNFQTSYTVGALPDAINFSPDGTMIAVANEGEPNDDYTVDPEGSISIIRLNDGVVQTASFTAYIGQEDDLRSNGIRIYGPGANAAQDLEPEYVVFSPDNATVYATLQENNALAIVDVASATVTAVKSFGYKDHAGRTPLGRLQGFDASNRVNDIRIWEHKVLGMYQPDAIKSFQSNGQTYLITANEGDSRDYDGFSEEARVNDLELDPTAYPSDYTQSNESLGRLKTTTTLGDTDGDGDVDQIYAYGARSFSIWDDAGNLVFDSGDEFERVLARLLPTYFNSTNDDNDSRKNRSDDKGPEPEAVTVGTINGTTYAFIGLERQSGIMVYDITDPVNAKYVTFFDNRNFDEPAGPGTGGDLGPEDIAFIESSVSPTGEPMLLVSNEVSGTVTAYTIFTGDSGNRFSLQILHNNDGESALLRDENVGVGGISAFATTVDSMRYAGFLRGEATILLSSGDNFLPGPAFSAGLQNSEFYDAIAIRALNYDALAIGNHDFDFGPDVLARFIGEVTNEVDPAKFLSANLDMRGEPSLQALVSSNDIAPSTVLYRGEEQIGVIGLTTTDLPFISSPGAVQVSDVLAQAVNAQVDQLQNRGINKIILISHLQGLNQDTALIRQLRGIDVVIAGGGDELLSNNPADTLPGLAIGGPYPLRLNDADNREVLVVTTAGNYRYLGQLRVTFDGNGDVMHVQDGSGPVKVSTNNRPFGLFNDIEAAISSYVSSLDARVLARTEVALDGVRGSVRTQETNQGNLIADALLWQARQVAADFGVSAPQVAFQNGGGIRNDAIIAANSDLTELSTFDMLPFSNFVSVIEEVPASQLKVILENAVSRVADVNGRFAQVAGLRFTYNPQATAQVLDADRNVTTAGERIIDVTLEDGTVLVASGMVQAGAPSVSIATVNFLARGGDQYPFNAPFTSLGVTYQQALANYLVQGLNGLVSAADYPEGGEGRIQTTSPRPGLVFGDAPAMTTKGATTILPNPATNFFEIQGAQEVAGVRTLSLFDLNGRQVVSRSERVAAGAYSERFSLAGLPRGMYTLTIQTPIGMESHRLIVD